MFYLLYINHWRMKNVLDGLRILPALRRLHHNRQDLRPPLLPSRLLHRPFPAPHHPSLRPRPRVVPRQQHPWGFAVHTRPKSLEPGDSGTVRRIPILLHRYAGTQCTA